MITVEYDSGRCQILRDGKPLCDLSIDEVRQVVSTINLDGDNELSGRPACRFTWLISERQFSVTHNHPSGERLLALSSSMSTWLKCMSDMLKIAHPDNPVTEFQILDDSPKPSDMNDPCNREIDSGE